MSEPGLIKYKLNAKTFDFIEKNSFEMNARARTLIRSFVRSSIGAIWYRFASC